MLQNEDKILDIVLDEKLVPLAPPIPITYVPAEQIMVGNEIEIEGSLSYREDDVEMSNDGFENHDSSDHFQNESSSSSTKPYDFDLSSPIDNSVEFFDRKPLELLQPKQEFMPIANLSPIQSFRVNVGPVEKVQPMEVEPIKSEERSRKTRCQDCGVYVMNISQHKRCVHDFSGAQQCPECKSVFPNRLKLLMHKYYKHVPPRYKCEFCHKQIR